LIYIDSKNFAVLGLEPHLWNSAADKIYERRKQAFRCITSDLGKTHRFRKGCSEVHLIDFEPETTRLSDLGDGNDSN